MSGDLLVAAGAATAMFLPPSGAHFMCGPTPMACKVGRDSVSKSALLPSFEPLSEIQEERFHE